MKKVRCHPEISGEFWFKLENTTFLTWSSLICFLLRTQNYVRLCYQVWCRSEYEPCLLQRIYVSHIYLFISQLCFPKPKYGGVYHINKSNFYLLFDEFFWACTFTAEDFLKIHFDTLPWCVFASCTVWNVAINTCLLLIWLCLPMFYPVLNFETVFYLWCDLMTCILPECDPIGLTQKGISLLDTLWQKFDQE